MSATVMAGVQLRRNPPAVPSAVLGMIIFVITEVMFFMALISAFMVIKSQVYGRWAPPGDLRLPVLTTGFNTCVLLASGVLLVQAARLYGSFSASGSQESRTRATSLYFQALMLGAFFVAFQGYEWVKLIGYGMTMTSGIFGATFFLLIGTHGLHALAAILALGWFGLKLRRGQMTDQAMKALTVFWLFVVGIWPILFGLVYFE